MLEPNNKDIPQLEFLDISEIIDALSGFVRITEFTYSNDDAESDPMSVKFQPKYNSIKSISEGQISYGHFNGFARRIDVNGECEMGYWKLYLDENVSRPYGKWAKYDSEGKDKVYVEGVYLGDLTSWNRLLRKENLNSDFRKNVVPRLSFGQIISDMFGGCGCCTAAQDQKA